MPFSPMNAPMFYNTTTKQLYYKWDTLFILQVETLENIGNSPVEVRNSMMILIVKNIFQGQSHFH